MSGSDSAERLQTATAAILPAGRLAVHTIDVDPSMGSTASANFVFSRPEDRSVTVVERAFVYSPVSKAGTGAPGETAGYVLCFD